jgi:hypothetical protein
MPFNKPKILGIQLIMFGAGVLVIYLALLLTPGSGGDISVGLLLSIITLVPFWVIPVISGICALMATGYKCVIFGTIISLLYCYPFISVAIKYGGLFNLYWILVGISIVALAFVIISRDDF